MTRLPCTPVRNIVSGVTIGLSGLSTVHGLLPFTSHTITPHHRGALADFLVFSTTVSAETTYPPPPSPPSPVKRLTQNRATRDSSSGGYNGAGPRLMHHVRLTSMRQEGATAATVVALASHDQIFSSRSSPNLKLSPPITAPPSPGSVTSNLEAISHSWGRNSSTSSSGHAASPPAMTRELPTADDAPPELDALRPTFPTRQQEPQHQQERRHQRRMPVTLAPVGVGGGEADTSPLPSLFSATSAAAAVPSDTAGPWRPNGAGSGNPPPGGHGWQQQQSLYVNQQYPSHFAELAPPRIMLTDESGSSSSLVTPAHAVGMRATTETDPGPSRALLEAAKIAAAGVGGSAVAGGGGGASQRVAAEGSRRTGYVQGRSVSSGGETMHYNHHNHVIVGLEGDGGPGGGGGIGGGGGAAAARNHGRRSSSGGERIRGPAVGASAATGAAGAAAAVDRRRRCSVDGMGGANSNNGINGMSGAVAGGVEPSTGTSASAGSGSGGGGGGGGNARVRIRGGGIDITSLLSSAEDSTEAAGVVEGPAGRRGDVTANRDRGSSGSVFHGGGYQSQDSPKSSPATGGGSGEFTYSSLGAGNALRAATPPSHTPGGSQVGGGGGGGGGGGVGGVEFRADWPDGRPPLVRKRSLTVAMDSDPQGSANSPSPRGRRRSCDRMDNPNSGAGSPDSCGSEIPPLLGPPRQQQQQQHGGAAAVSGGGGGGGGGGGSSGFSPRGGGTRSGGPPPRDCALSSPSRDRFGGEHPSSLTVTAGGVTAAAGAGSNNNNSKTINSSNASLSTSSAGATSAAAASAAVGADATNSMDVDWAPADNSAPPGAGGTLPGSTTIAPSPVPSTALVSAPGSALGRPPSPFSRSPGREYLKNGGLRGGGAPHSPSPRRGAPPSPSQGPGGAGLRRRATRRMSNGRVGGRVVHCGARIGVGKGGGAFGGGGGGSGEIVAGSSGTYESDYDSDLSEMSAYSAMGSLERQLQQDTFFELDETLWMVVTRREMCNADKCVYRNPHTRISLRKHYHATCSHIHQEGEKKGMRFHHHQLEKVKKHQRSHSSHQSRVPRQQGGIASPSMGVGRARSLDGQSSREGMSSGGEEDGGEEEPWSAHDVELLDSLVRNYGTGRWGQISGHFANRGPSQCAKQWALGSRSHHPQEHVGGSNKGGVAGPGVASPVAVGPTGPGVSGGWAVPPGDHHHHHHHHRPVHLNHHQGHVAPVDGSGLSASAVAAVAAAGGGSVGGGVGDGGASVSAGQLAAAARHMPVGVGVGMPFGPPAGGGGSGAGGSGRGPKGVGSWTKEEDDRLNALVAAFGVKWSQISDHMPGRVGKQCRERYLNHLDPSLRHGPWTEEEEALLLSLHARLNNQWAEIARQIPGRSDNDVKNRWNLVCRRERAAEKNLQRVNSGSSAASSSGAAAAAVSSAVAAAIAGAPPRHGRTLSSGTVEAAASAAALLGELPDGTDRNCNRGGSRSLPVSRAVSSEEQQSMIEAREAAEAGAGLVKLAAVARAALEHSNFEAGGGGVGHISAGVLGGAADSGMSSSIKVEGNNNSTGGVGGGGVAMMKRPPTPPMSPRFSRGEPHRSVPTVSPRFHRSPRHGNPGPSSSSSSSSSAQPSTPTQQSSPRYARRDGQGSSKPPRSPPREGGHPPRSPPRSSGQSMTPPLPGYRGAGAPLASPPPPPPPPPPPAPPQSPYSPRSGHHQPLAIPRSPASENFRSAMPAAHSGSGGGSGGGSGNRHGGGIPGGGVRRTQGAAADVDARRAAIAARATAGGGVAAWAWGGRV